MNRVAIAAIAVVIVLVAAIAVMGYDASKDGQSDQTVETDGNDETFQWPRVNNVDMGSIEIEHRGDTVAFSAKASLGYEFVRWIDVDGAGTYSQSMQLEFPIGSIPEITAEFRPLEGNMVIDLEWKLPMFGEDGVTATSEQHFTTVIASEDWDALQHSEDIQRRAQGDVIVPGELVCHDEVVESIADYLEPMVSGMTNLQKAIVIMYFVQDAIGYETDVSQYGTEEFWATPLETVYSGYGDCEDTAVLYVSIALAMGLDSGLVSFEDPEQGHMSVAVALEEGEQLVGGSTFTVGQRTYAYVETAVDGENVALGMLSPAYDIAEGKWTHVEYDPESDMFFVSDTVAISDTLSTARYGEIVYGSGPAFSDSVSQPPTIPMQVGDSFTYVPTTSLPSEIVASGSGIMGTYGGSFLTWDPETNTLSGTATQPGHYVVTLSATWTDGHIQQTAYQIIEFDVTAAGSGYVGQDKELTYASGEWNLETITTEPVDPDDGIPVAWIVAGILAVIFVGAVVVRAVA